MPVFQYKAATIDGAGPWKILWTIVVPLSWPAISVVALFSFMNNWNEFIWPLVVVKTTEMRPVTIGLTLFFMTLGLNSLSRRIVKRFRQEYE